MEHGIDETVNPQGKITDNYIIENDSNLIVKDFLENSNFFEQIKQEGGICFVFLCPDLKIENSQQCVKAIAKDAFYRILDKSTDTHPRDSYIVRKGNVIIRILYDKILYIFSDNSRCVFHLKNNKEISVYKRLDEIECELHSSRFMRCHQSYIVNMDFVLRADDDFLLTTNDTVPIRCKSRRIVKERFFEYAQSHL